jgi:Zn-dependent protease
VFYKLNASRVTLREFWWETKLLVWIGLIVKLLRIRLRGSSDDLAVDSLHPFLCEAQKIQPETLSRFEPTLSDLRKLGFGLPVWHDEDDVFQATHNTLATLRHESGRVWARVQCRISLGRVPAKIKFFTTLISLTPGGFIATGNGKYDMAWPATHDTIRFRHMSVDELWKHHQQRMTAAVQPISQDQLLDVAEEYHATLRDFHLNRGVFEPLGEEEFALYSVPMPPEPAHVTAPPPVSGLDGAGPPLLAMPTLPPPDLMEIATLDELRRLQNKKANWRFSLALLLLSAVFFIMNSRSADQGQNWEYVVMLVGILLFHEMGHYLAMKAFGYRNLKMFFIPGFGAAVSGRHYNAPAWKKIVVSLMGPLPGILAGVVLLILCSVLHKEILYRIGLFTIILNVFNLIPILPFDGGWVAHAVLFSRHPKLDVGFRLIAALLLVAIGIWMPGARFLTYIAVFSLMALPLANKLAMIVSELRKVPGLGVSPDSQTIPPETARIILAKVRQRITRNLNAKLAAQHVASVFESLNARPPSIGASIGLLSLHGLGILIAVVASILAIGLHRNDLFGKLRAQQAQYVVSPEQVQLKGELLAGPRKIVIARFKKESAAQAAYDAMPAARSALRFGQTILAGFTAQEASEQQMMFSHYEKIAEDIFVESNKMHALVSMSFKLPPTARGRETLNDLQLYLQESTWGLIPPWASDDDWPAAQRAAQTSLRRMVQELQQPPMPASSTVEERWNKIVAAERRGDTAEVEQLQAELKRDADVAQKLQRAQIAQRFGHADLIQKWEDIAAGKTWVLRQNRIKKEIAPELGQWPLQKSKARLATSGFAVKAPKDDHIHLQCGFVETDAGLLAMTQWLFAQGATDVRYIIQGVPSGPGNGEMDGVLDEDAL